MKTKRSRARRTIAISVAGLMAVAPLAACSTGGATDGSDGRTTITFSYLWAGPEAASLQKIISNYNKSQDKVKVVGVSSPDGQKQLTSMSASKGSFDISDNFGNAVGAWASKGIIVPLDSYFKSNKIDTSDFLSSTMKQMKYKGKTYALPVAVSCNMLMYNKKLFAAAGLTPPTTTDELASDAITLTKTDSAGNITQLGLGEPAAGSTQTNIAPAFGGSWWGKKGQPTPMNPGNIEAMTWYQKNIVKKLGADKIAKFVSGEGQWLSAQDPFYTGKMAMRIDGEWNGASTPKVAPNLDWGVVPIPAASPKYKDSTSISSSILFIPANSQHKDAAARFLAYMVGPKAMKAFTLTLSNLPARTSLLDSQDYSGIVNFSSYADLLKNSPNTYAPSSASDAAEYGVDLTKALGAIAADTATPQQSLQQLQSRVASYAAN